MAQRTEGEVRARRNDLFVALAHRRRRAVLSVLDRLSAADPAALANHVLAAETDESLSSVDSSAARRVRVALEHVHLPRLRDANLIRWTGDAVTTTGHPAVDDPKFDEILRVDDSDWDEVLANLAVRRRRIVLSTLHSHGEAVDRADLAFAVARTEQRAGRENPVERVIEDLHHVHLPELSAAGLVEYDADAGRVSYQGHPALDDQWVYAGNDDAPRAILSVADHSGDIWTLEGRDNVTERSRALCAVADEELFTIVTDDGLVEEACLEQLEDATDRGVDVYLGTHSEELRDRVRDFAPGATVWKPQLDWLSARTQGGNVGRLVVADREAVMIGTLGEVGPGGVPTETAITATGPANPLVMLLRDLLGSRLEHLDEQRDDFRSEIPL